MRAVQMTGAMDAAVDLTVRHAIERLQFGRRLAAFQAVQQLAADAAAEATLARRDGCRARASRRRAVRL
jgi:acyl-CoA dehydrogenase